MTLAEFALEAQRSQVGEWKIQGKGGLSDLKFHGVQNEQA